MTDHGGRGGSVEPLCRACATNASVIRRQVRRNEQRMRNGKPVDLSLVRRCKEAMATCAARDHGLTQHPSSA